MVSNVTTCHAPPPESPIPASLAQRTTLAVVAASDSLISCHPYALGVALAKSALAKTQNPSPRVTYRSGAGYAAATKATAPKTTKPKTTKPKITTPKTTTSSSTPTTPAALAFLDDKNLSVEDKLMRLLAYLNDKMDKDIEKKMREASGTDGKPATSSSSSSSGITGALGKLAGIAKDVFPAGAVATALQNPLVRNVVSKIAGPALAAAASAAGFPELAPLALQYGPSLVSAAAGASTALDAAPVTSGSSTSAKADGSTPDRQTQLKLMEIQRLMDQQKEMFSLVSNMLRSRHELRMGVIQNTR
jgi:hypothetical protein